MRIDLTQTPIYFEEDGGDGGGAPAPAPAGDGGSGSPAGAAAEPPAADPFDDPANERFDRTYVERLRREAADARVSGKPFKDAFDGYQQEEVEALLDLVTTIRQDPRTAAARMAELVDVINQQFQEEAPPGEEPEVVTRAEVERMLAEREQEKSISSAVQSIEQQASELGYKKGSRDYVTLLWTAQNETNYDLKAAHETIKADRQRVIDEYVSGKEKDADGSATRPPGGGAGSEPRKAGDFKDARARLEARLAAVPGQ